MRRTAGPSTAVTLGLLGAASFCLLVSAPALAAPKPDPLPVPKPQPKQPPPPPRQAPQPPPPTFQPPPPSAVVAPQPSAAELATAARERAAALAAQRRAAKSATARWRAAKRRAADARADSTRQQKLLRGEANGTQENPRKPVANLWPAASASSSSRGPVIPFVAGLGALALLLLIIALIPARAAPWYWAERMLATRQQQFALTGVIGLFSVAVSFAVVFLTG